MNPVVLRIPDGTGTGPIVDLARDEDTGQVHVTVYVGAVGMGGLPGDVEDWFQGVADRVAYLARQLADGQVTVCAACGAGAILASRYSHDTCRGCRRSAVTG